MNHPRSIVAVRIIAIAGLLTLAIIGGITMESKIALEKREEAFSNLDGMDTSRHGGYYLSDNGTVLNINELEGQPLGIAESRLVRVHKAQYSLEALKDLEEQYTPHMLEWHIQLLYVDYPANRLNITLYDAQPGDEACIRALAPEEEMIQVHYADKPMETLMGKIDPPIHKTDEKALRAVNEAIKDGGALLLGAGEFFHAYCSATCGISWQENGETVYGVLTCGHGQTVGENILYFPPKSSGAPYDENSHNPDTHGPDDVMPIGKTKAAYYQDQLDCALISREYENVHMAGVSLSGLSAATQSGVPRVGATVWSSGVWTNSAATVTANDAKATTTDGHVILHTMVTDVGLIRGDSGSPLFYMTNDGNLSLCGIASAGSDTHGVFVRYSENRSAAGFTMTKF